MGGPSLQPSAPSPTQGNVTAKGEGALYLNVAEKANKEDENSKEPHCVTPLFALESNSGHVCKACVCASWVCQPVKDTARYRTQPHPSPLTSNGHPSSPSRVLRLMSEIILS